VSGPAFDHVVLAAGPDGLTATAQQVAARVGGTARPGGSHPTYGTRNAVVALEHGYVEVVAVEDPDLAAGSPFGSVVARRCADGGGWVGWAVAVDDLGPVAHRLGLTPVPGGRTRPDGVRLGWEQAGVETLAADPWLPFFLTWRVPADLHPAAGGPAGVTVAALVAAAGPGATDGSDAADRLHAWLGGEPPVPLRWAPAADRTGLLAVVVRTPSGPVTLT